MLQGIHTSQLDDVWPQVEGWVHAAVLKSQHDYTVQDIKEFIRNRSMQLWVWYEGDEIVACLVSTIIVFPRRKVCSLPFIGGRAMRKWLTSEVEEIVAQWAREQGCSQFEGYCRDGWLRLLPHWNKVWTTMRRNI